MRFHLLLLPASVQGCTDCVILYMVIGLWAFSQTAMLTCNCVLRSKLQGRVGACVAMGLGDIQFFWRGMLRAVAQ
jgi:hypothetical protein